MMRMGSEPATVHAQRIDSLQFRGATRLRLRRVTKIEAIYVSMS
jgi:hypothetical protein